MKKFIGFSFFIFSSSAFSCVNLSGHYVTEAQATYSLVQDGCESMDMTDLTGKNTILFNQTEQKILDTVMDEARVEIYIKGSINEKAWTYNERAVVTYADHSQVTTESWSEVFPIPEQALITIKHLSDGTTETYIDTRVP